MLPLQRHHSYSDYFSQVHDTVSRSGHNNRPPPLARQEPEKQCKPHI